MVKDHKVVWTACLAIIKKSIDSQPFKTWFEPIKPIKFENDILTIQVPNKFFYEWLEEHYVALLKKAIKQEIGQNGRLEYQIMVDNHKKIGVSDNMPKLVKKINVAEFPASVPNPFFNPNINKVRVDAQLSTNYIFDQFILGECNRFPVSAGMAIAKKPGGTAFNPLIVYGDVGLGKTHLIQAIGNKILFDHSEKQVLYVTTEKFTNQVIQAIKTNSVNDFMNFYQMIDVLIVDDIQFLANRTKTQEIFFNIFNQLHQAGKQIILSSDRPPKDLQDVEARLISRFKWGLVADLKSPDFETRKKILNKKLENENLSLPDDIKEYICSNIKNNIREIEGVVISLVAQSSLNRKAIDMKLVKEVIRQFVSHVDQEISLENIKSLVANHFDIPIEKLGGKTRLREVVMARQLSMYIAKTYTNNSLKVIGDSFGGRDHSTVIHSLKTIQDLMDTDNLFKDKVIQIVKKVKSNLIST